MNSRWDCKPTRREIFTTPSPLVTRWQRWCLIMARCCESADGRRTEILANGFRAANGVCLNPDGSFVVTDQEGILESEEPHQLGDAGSRRQAEILRQHVWLSRCDRHVRRRDGSAVVLDHERV